MLQLQKPLTMAESQLLIQCITDLQSSFANTSNQYFVKHTALISAKQKLLSQVYDCFYREEITNMVFALDCFCRKCNAHLSGNISPEDAAIIGKNLRIAASAHTKLKQSYVNMF